MLAQLALSLDGDHRRHGRRGRRWTQRIWWRTNTCRMNGVFLFSPRARTRSAQHSAQVGWGLYNCLHRHASPRPYAPTHPHATRAPLAHVRDHPGRNSRPTRSLHPHVAPTNSRTHPRTRTHAPEPATGWTRRAQRMHTHAHALEPAVAYCPTSDMVV